jgi:transmembrane 9 superfamily member 3
MFAIWLFVSFPLTVVGTLFGRHWAGKADFPCRVNSMARPIPLGPWYTSPSVIIAATGILPFGSIFIEMYFIFTSFWNYKCVCLCIVFFSCVSMCVFSCECVWVCASCVVSMLSGGGGLVGVCLRALALLFRCLD